MKVNDLNIFASLQQKHALGSANKIVPMLLGRLGTEITSVVDVGCGIGAWLKTFQDKGIKDIKGYDHFSVEPKLLSSIKDYVDLCNLDKPLNVGRRYDLAVCLEVAEHLKSTSANHLINSLCGFSNLVLFAAAIPGQARRSYKWHTNEQWQSYWCEKFEAKNYVPLDFIRKKFWADKNLPLWYKQNIFLYVKKDILDQHPKIANHRAQILDIVHPDLFKQRERDGFE